MSISRMTELLELFKACENGSILTTSCDVDCIKCGKMYSVEKVVNYSATDTAYHVIDLRALGAKNKRFTAYPTIFATSNDSVTMTLGTVTGYSGGTEVTPTQRNYYYAESRPSDCVIKYNVTPTGFASLGIERLVGVESAFLNSGGGSATPGRHIILDPSKIYAYKMSAAPADLSLYIFIEWLESDQNPDLGF